MKCTFPFFLALSLFGFSVTVYAETHRSIPPPPYKVPVPAKVVVVEPVEEVILPYQPPVKVDHKFTGFYVGADIGVNHFYGKAKSDATVTWKTNPGSAYTFSLMSQAHGALYDNAFLGGLNVGYGYAFDYLSLFFGVELFVNSAHRKGKVSDGAQLTSDNITNIVNMRLASDTTVKLRDVEWGIDFKPGIMLPVDKLKYIGDAMLYMRLGVAFNRLTIKDSDIFAAEWYVPATPTNPASTGSAAVSSSHSEHVVGPRIGLGLEAYITGDLSVSIDYVYTDWEAQSSSRSETVSTSDPQGGPDYLIGSAKASVASQRMFIGLKYYFN